jgi:hypothetical protein
VNLGSKVLANIDFSNTDLHRSNFAGANLKNAKLLRANLGIADLSGADLSGADLQGAALNGANLSNVNLRHANLIEVDFANAIFDNADLSNAQLAYTIFSNNDLSSAKGLGTTKHLSPSTIGIDTIFRSGGNIPDSFLAGAGVPDNFINYIHSFDQPIEYYSCFISYAHEDELFASHLYKDLQKNSVRCWYAPHDLPIGERMRTSIDRSILIYDKLLLILSCASVVSDWVESEVETAMDKERKQGKLIVFPIRIDNAVMKTNTGWAAYIKRTRNIGDFRQWEEDEQYKKSLQKLLHDLKTEQTAPTPVPILSQRPNKPLSDSVILDEQRIRIKNLLYSYFNESELRDLAFDLNVDYDDLIGQTRQDKARELIMYFERHRPGGIQTLAEYIRSRRPQIFD